VESVEEKNGSVVNPTVLEVVFIEAGILGLAGAELRSSAGSSRYFK
jgi:hypothetical protein